MDFLSKQRFEEFTEQEFIDFLNELFREDESGIDERPDKLLLHFKDLAGHPLGSDLIYYPESGADNSAEGITQTIKEWREANGLPGFKKAPALNDNIIDTWTTPESAPGKIHLIITDHFKWGNENEAQHLKLLQEKNKYLSSLYKKRRAYFGNTFIRRKNTRNFRRGQVSTFRTGIKTLLCGGSGSKRNRYRSGVRVTMNLLFKVARHMILII